MRHILLVFLLVAAGSPVSAQYVAGDIPLPNYRNQQQQQPNVVWVDGYYDTYGNWVDGYYRTVPNGTNWDNYSTQGNRNPYNGNQGTRAPDYSPNAGNYGQGQVIYQGPHGGQYYYNAAGHKVYIPKQP